MELATIPEVVTQGFEGKILNALKACDLEELIRIIDELDVKLMTMHNERRLQDGQITSERDKLSEAIDAVKEEIDFFSMVIYLSRGGGDSRLLISVEQGVPFVELSPVTPASVRADWEKIK